MEVDKGALTITRRNCTSVVSIASLLLVLVMTGCGTTGVAVGAGFHPDERVNLRNVKLVMMQPDVHVYELPTAGQPEQVPEWEAQARANLVLAIQHSSVGSDIQFIDSVDQLTPEQHAIIDEHLALYYQVASAALITGQSTQRAWKHKKGAGFDYTLGDGLAFLKPLSGADAALIVVAEDYISTGGRKTVAALGALVGAYVPLGQSFIALGLVELSSGNIAWANFVINKTGADLRNPQDAQELIDGLLETYGL